MIEHYKPSGRVGAKSFFQLICGGAVLVAGLAYPYQLLLAWIPFIYVNLLVVIIFALIVAGMGNVVVQKGPVRNQAVGFAMGVLLAASALMGKYWFQYKGFLSEALTEIEQQHNLPEGMSKEEALNRLRQEITLREFLKMRVEDGWVTGRLETQTNGFMVYVVWLFEAGIFVGFAAFSNRSHAGKPFDEHMGVWMDDAQLIAEIPVQDPALKEDIQSARDLETLLAIPAPTVPDSSQFLLYQLYENTEDTSANAYLSIEFVHHEPNAKGEQVKMTATLVKYATVSPENRGRLMARAEKVNALREGLQNPVVS